MTRVVAWRRRFQSIFIFLATVYILSLFQIQISLHSIVQDNAGEDTITDAESLKAPTGYFKQNCFFSLRISSTLFRMDPFGQVKEL